MSVSHEHVLPAKPFQFGLRTLFIGIALLGVLLAIMAHLEPVWSLALVWSLLLIAAHVAANVWGTKSRATPPPRPTPDDAAYALSNAAIEFAPATRLRHSSRPLTPCMLSAAVVGATLGAIGGTTTIICLYHGTVSYLGTSIASISGGTLGALLAFLASSFLGITARAFREAAQSSCPTSPRR